MGYSWGDMKQNNVITQHGNYVMVLKPESEQALGDGEGQGSLACYSPWGCRVGRD